MKHLRWLVSVTGLLMFAQVSSLQAEIQCSLSDYRGTYAFYATGAFITLPPEAAPLLGPFAQAGTFTSDGQGNLIIESTPSFNGFIAPSAQEATYTLSPECILTISLVLPILEVPSTFYGALNSGNRGLTITVTDPPGTVIVGEHMKQDTRFCGTADFSGAYQIDITGDVIGSGPFHRGGRLVSDGQGRFSATTVANYAGFAVPENFEGTYSLNARCSLELNYTHEGEDITIFGALAGHGEQFAVTVATPGWAAAGVLRAQQ